MLIVVAIEVSDGDRGVPLVVMFGNNHFCDFTGIPQLFTHAYPAYLWKVDTFFTDVNSSFAIVCLVGAFTRSVLIDGELVLSFFPACYSVSKIGKEAISSRQSARERKKSLCLTDRRSPIADSH